MRRAICVAAVVFASLATVSTVFAQQKAVTADRIETPKNEFIKAVVFFDSDGKPRDAEGSPVLDANGDIVVELDLGEPIAQIFGVVPRMNLTFRMEQQIETSLSISDEGPHLDLRDWNHWTSGWKEVEMKDPLRFVPEEPGGENLPFPRVTTEEIAAAVTDLLKDDPNSDSEGWISLARQCRSENDGPCIVTVSEVRLRISVKNGADWKPVQLIRLIVPMGC